MHHPSYIGSSAAGRAARKWPKLSLRLPRRWRRSLVLSLLFGPAILAALYFGLVASDRYVAEASFVVRTASKPNPTSPLGGLLQMTGIIRSQDDAFAVHEFIASRDAVQELEKRLPLREMFDRPEADFLARYPSILYNSTFERLYSYYGQRVEIIYNTSTGISTLRVQAFRPEDAQAIARALLDIADELLLRMNARIRNDAVRNAAVEVENAEKRMLEAQVAITAFRNRELMIDPGQSSLIISDVIGKLSDELAQVQAQVQQAQAASPSGPQVAALQRRVVALQSQIAAERDRISGRSDGLAEKMAAYDSLNLQRDFASRTLATSVTSLESARSDARRQTLYLERIVEPAAPDYPTEPRRLHNVLLIFILSVLLVFIGWLIVTGIEEHAHASH